MIERLALSPRAELADQTIRQVLADPVLAAELDALVIEAARLVGARSGQISMLTDRQVSLSVQGLFAASSPAGAEHPFDQTICACALRADDALVIPDATVDPRVSSLHAVADGLVGAYLGVPLRAASGAMIGVLCVFDAAPHSWSAEQTATVEAIGHEIASRLRALTPATADRRP